MSAPGFIKDIEPASLALVQSLSEVVKNCRADSLLLSGGLDTSILACLSAGCNKPYCITVAFKNAPAPDVDFARWIASNFELKHYIHYFGEEELEEGIQEAIRVLKSFDPMEIRNSAAAYIALKTARDKGYKKVMTGDGGDELFAGYSFFFGLDKQQLDSALAKMWANMTFSSIYLARDLGIEAKLPFLEPEIKRIASELDSGLKINKEKERVYGKWILRKAFEKELSPEIVWREKAPLEVGTGTTILPDYFNSRIPDSEYADKKAAYLKQDEVNIRSKEQLHYYEYYKKSIGIPGKGPVHGRNCPDCGAQIRATTDYCYTCGAYPVSL